MAATRVVRAFAAVFALSGISALYAQKPAAPAPAAPPAAAAKPPAKPVPEPKLAFDREVFSYPGGTRRDPFKPLIGKESLGPLFDDLKLKGIIYSTDAARSIVLIQDGAKRLYRLHRGDVVGNSRVVEIRPLLVRFAVENFGIVRNEFIELRPGAAAAEGISLQPTPAAAATQAIPGPDVNMQKMDKASAKRMLDSLARERRAKAAAKKQPGNDDWPFQPEARQ